MAGPGNAYKRHGQELATELDAARTEIEAAREAGRQATVAAQAQVEAARQAQEDAARALRAAEGAAAGVGAPWQNHRLYRHFCRRQPVSFSQSRH